MTPLDSRSQMVAARLTTAAILVMGLYLGKPVLMPLGVALLLAFMLQPVVRWLRRFGLSNGLAVGCTAAVFFALVGLLVWVIAGQVQALGGELPKYRTEITEKFTQIRAKLRGGSIETIKSTMSEVIKEVEEKERVEDAAKEDAAKEDAAKEDAAKTTTEAPSTTADAPPAPVVPQVEEPPPTRVIVTREESAVDLNSAAVLLTPLGTAGLVMLLIVLMLFKWADLRARLFALVGHNVSATTAVLDDAASRVSRYLSTQLMINAGTGLFVWGGLSVIGLEYAGLMGLCAGLFRYIPYVGPVAAAALPLALSVAMSSGWGPFIAVGIFFIVMELVLNNVIEPWLYGPRLGVSEIGIILAAVVWTILWGPAGLVLATPLTVCLVVLGEKVPGLAFFSKMLSDRVYLPAHALLTQRLLAGDTIEASDILARYREKASSEETFDAVVVPALARVRHEQRIGHLDATTAAGIGAALPPMLAELALAEPESPVSLTKDSLLVVWSLCPMTEVAASMLPDRFHQLACRFEFFNTQSLAFDVIARLKEHPPLAIALLHLDPSDYPRVTATLRRLRRGVPEIPIVVGRWGDQPLTHVEREELAKLGTPAIVSTPAELAAWVSPRALSVARLQPASD